jgi:hypothetical protein
MAIQLAYNSIFLAFFAGGSAARRLVSPLLRPSSKLSLRSTSPHPHQRHPRHDRWVHHVRIPAYRDGKAKFNYILPPFFFI